jgi:hypothetical protein
VTTDPPEAAVTETPTPTPTAEPAPEAEAGTRANPLAVGEFRKLTTESMWTVGAEGATEVHDAYVVLPLRIAFDWASYAQQIADAGQGGSVDDGIDPWGSLMIEYVTAGGRSYNTMDNYNVTIPNQFYDVGTVYPPAEQVSVNVPVSVPNEEIPGGTWVVKNYNNDAVFIATQ